MWPPIPKSKRNCVTLGSFLTRAYLYILLCKMEETALLPHTDAVNVERADARKTFTTMSDTQPYYVRLLS